MTIYNLICQNIYHFSFITKQIVHIIKKIIYFVVLENCILEVRTAREGTFIALLLFCFFLSAFSCIKHFL